MSREEDLEGVGYKRPPRHTRFRKGQSGNPSGRRKARPRLSLMEELDKLLGAPIRVVRNGRHESISLLEALLSKTRDQALKGDAKASQKLFALVAQYEQAAGAETGNATTEPEEKLLARFLARDQAGGGNG